MATWRQECKGKPDEPGLTKEREAIILVERLTDWSVDRSWNMANGARYCTEQGRIPDTITYQTRPHSPCIFYVEASSTTRAAALRTRSRSRGCVSAVSLRAKACSDCVRAALV